MGTTQRSHQGLDSDVGREPTEADPPRPRASIKSVHHGMEMIFVAGKVEDGVTDHEIEAIVAKR